MRVTAYCPGHITGFFVPCVHEDPLRTGSRGAGICIDRGVTATLEVLPGDGSMEFIVDGVMRDAPVMRDVLENLMGGGDFDIMVEASLGLPISSGFGMSAAGALATAFAMAEALGRTTEEAFAAAHRAELANGTGLGDVAALSRGGMTFRRREGIPPFGRIDRLTDALDIVAAVVGPVIRTSDVLRDPTKRKTIDSIGRECYRLLAKDPTPDMFFRTSREFTMRSGLAGPPVMDALEAIERLGDASMIMLGNSIFARGDLDAMQSELSRFGTTYRLSLDLLGPRVLSSEGSLV
ncbi:MAG: GHMP kinase [Methanomassiliicoccus sp.]|nr:GHMP kinase [Methanomassiliicoccus sp.]